MKFLTVIIFLLSCPVFLLGHGLHMETFSGAACVKFLYDDGFPIAFSEVEIFSPAHESIFQTGLTDKNGVFCFHPDADGTWKIKIDDGMGHMKIYEIEISDFSISPTNNQNFSLWQKLMIGISLIFGITGLLFYFSVRKTH